LSKPSINVYHNSDNHM